MEAILRALVILRLLSVSIYSDRIAQKLATTQPRQNV